LVGLKLLSVVTTSAGVLHAGIAYRTAAFDRAAMDKIAPAIVENTKRLES